MPGTANDLNISESGYVTFDGIATFHGRTFQAGTGITITNPDGTSGNSTISSTASLTDLHAPRFIVASSTSGTGANFTTITAAIAAAAGTGINSTIFIQPGTYTENFTLPPGINLTAFDCDANTPNVTIVGTITMTAAGTSTISGIRLQTNSAALLAVTGNSASILNLKDCYLNATNNTGITYSSSSASSRINILSCLGNIGTTGIGLFTHTSAGVLNFWGSNFSNTGASTTASTISAGTLGSSYTSFASPITSSGTAILSFFGTQMDNSAQNATCLTTAGTGSGNILSSSFYSGSASAISIGTGTTITASCVTVSSSNTNAVTGLGVLTNGGITFVGTSSLINTTTQTAKNIDTGGISFDGGTNVLNTYTVGTWTPTIVPTGGAFGTETYVNQVGTYTKIGDTVFLQFYVNLSAWTIGTATGSVQIGGLPFTSKNTTLLLSEGSLRCSNVTYVGNMMYATISPNVVLIDIQRQTTGAAAANLPVAGLSATAEFASSIYYKV